jgi:hypothetical protein
MRELPILFSAPMVRAILGGRKTVTRRAVGPQPQPWAEVIEMSPYVSTGPSGLTHSYGKPGHAVQRTADDQRQHGLCKVPYQVGDRLYVRETVRILENLDHGRARARYEADQTYATIHGLDRLKPILNGRCVPNGCHREAARLWLEVIDVRVERLQDITYEDAVAEGVHRANRQWCANDERGACFQYPQQAFANLWDGLAKPGTRWADNVWVWVVEFRRIEGTR